METYSLTDPQRDRAKELYHKVDDGEISASTELVNEWKTPPRIPDPKLGSDSDYLPYPEETEFINPSNIAGTFESNINRFNSGRIKSHLARFHNDEFWREDPAPPRLQKIDNEYYVTSDGIHRSLTAKALALPELKCIYSIPPEEVLVHRKDR
ncbi:hypothetical protein [Halocalculus aciditolerans]|uniref:ParB/Sulfiredoxin domain-containing protein n=1 Tax=Halocalculus aciditolerans TaxID=1383812 RepID=A0A830FEK1_9EURY|nr:hypothetical protein [Halocalculus aciditolerans]GGL67257.1 hypothetical protein GCM10009039_26610 [Halocalculus aciditolerans]